MYRMYWYSCCIDILVYNILLSIQNLLGKSRNAHKSFFYQSGDMSALYFLRWAEPTATTNCLFGLMSYFRWVPKVLRTLWEIPIKCLFGEKQFFLHLIFSTQIFLYRIFWVDRFFFKIWAHPRSKIPPKVFFLCVLCGEKQFQNNKKMSTKSVIEKMCNFICSTICSRTN